VRRFDTIYQNLTVARLTIDIPLIISNGTVTIDTATAVGAAPLGTHIITWAPVSLATSMDDLIVTWMIVAVDTVRTILQNPTGGGINPDSIDFEFVLGQVNSDIDP